MEGKEDAKNPQRNPFYSLRKLKILEHEISFLSVKGEKKKKLKIFILKVIIFEEVKNSLYHHKLYIVWKIFNYLLTSFSVLVQKIFKKKKSYILFFSITKWNFNEINGVPGMKQERKGGRPLFRKFALSFGMLPPRINSHIITSR